MFENIPQKASEKAPAGFASLEHIAWRRKKILVVFANYLESHNYLKKSNKQLKYSLCYCGSFFKLLCYWNDLCLCLKHSLPSSSLPRLLQNISFLLSALGPASASLHAFKKNRERQREKRKKSVFWRHPAHFVSLHVKNRLFSPLMQHLC